VTRLLALSALAALFIVLVAACTGSGTPILLGDTPLTADVAERLITKTEIEAAGGNGGELNQSVEDLLEIASSLDTTRPPTIEALWSVRWTASGRPGALMTLTRFREAPGAHGALDKIESGVAYHAMNNAIGDRSALSPANADIGTAVTFLHGRTLVAFQLPVASDGSTLLNEQQLLKLAAIIEAKL
jgi:hypothetical protein